MKLRVIHKGTAFLLLILTLQILLFVQFFRLVDKAEKFAAREAEERLLADAASEMILELCIAPARFTDRLFGDPHSDNNPAAFRRRVEAILARTAPFEAEHPEVRQVFKETRELAAAEYTLIKDVNDAAEVENQSDLARIGLLLRFREPFQAHLARLEVVKDLMIEMRQKLDAAAAQEEAAKAQLKREISFGLLVEILCTVLLLAAFLIDITKRLSLVVQNAKMIPSGKPLPQTVSGSDELAYLDTVLHQSANALRRAAEHRKSTMAMVAHDLRIPLMASRLTVHNMLQADSQDARARRLKQQMDRLIGLVEDLLTIDVLEDGRLELQYDMIDIKSTLDAALDEVCALADEKGISLESTVEKARLPADPNRLIQVFANLLSNAIKYSSFGSSIQITSAKQNGLLRVTVTDHGPGIAKAQQESIFEKFYQANESDAGQGFGLGLAICKLIITAHDGSIGVDSERDKGSSFWFELPLRLRDEVDLDESFEENIDEQNEKSSLPQV